jgi:glycerol transport system ATP-binding protein
VRDDVNAILFDEPLTVIDPHMKWQLRTKLKEACTASSGHTMIYVTHDQTEALTFADKVVVMYEGEVVQIGTPEELFNEPAHTFVGYFIGSPGMNVIPCEIRRQNRKCGRRPDLSFRRVTRPPAAKANWAFDRNLSRCHRTRAAFRFKSIAVENIGRFKIVRANLQGHAINALLKENEEVPADPTLSFETAGSMSTKIRTWSEREPEDG